MIVAVVSLFALVENAAAATIHVPADYPTIQAAIDAADTGDEVVVAEGEYFESIDLLGKAITVRSTDPDDPFVVANTIINGDGAYHVVQFVSGEGPDTVLSGFTITGGNANGPGYLVKFGGGVHCCSSSPTLINCTVTGNTAAGGGGGVTCWFWESTPTLIKCTITGNTADSGAGVFCGESGQPKLINCTVAGNTASAGAGGVHCFDANPTLINCTVAGNTTAGGGGWRGLLGIRPDSDQFHNHRKHG